MKPGRYALLEACRCPRPAPAELRAALLRLVDRRQSDPSARLQGDHGAGDPAPGPRPTPAPTAPVEAT